MTRKGSTFDAFLEEEGIKEEVHAAASARIHGDTLYTEEEHYAALKQAWKSYHMLALATNVCKPTLDGRCHGCGEIAHMEAKRFSK